MDRRRTCGALAVLMVSVACGSDEGEAASVALADLPAVPAMVGELAYDDRGALWLASARTSSMLASHRLEAASRWEEDATVPESSRLRGSGDGTLFWSGRAGELAAFAYTYEGKTVSHAPPPQLEGYEPCELATTGPAGSLWYTCARIVAAEDREAEPERFAFVRFERKTGQWTRMPGDLAVPRQFLTITALADGRLLVQSPERPLAIAEFTDVGAYLRPLATRCPDAKDGCTLQLPSDGLAVAWRHEGAASFVLRRAGNLLLGQNSGPPRGEVWRIPNGALNIDFLASAPFPKQDRGAPTVMSFNVDGRERLWVAVRIGPNTVRDLGVLAVMTPSRKSWDEVWSEEGVFPLSIVTNPRGGGLVLHATYSTLAPFFLKEVTP